MLRTLDSVMASTGRSASRRPAAPVPMLATLGRPPSGDDWYTEWKFDGQRGLIVAADRITVCSRNGADVTRTFPEIATHLTEALGTRQLILDGEIIAPDAQGRPSFERLQQRWPQQRRPSAQLLRDVPVRFYAFDILAVDGRDVTARPYVERRLLLEDCAAATSGLLVVPRFASSDISAADMLAIAAENGMEGIVAKRPETPYRPGRSSAWIKCPVRRSTDVVIVGWWPAAGPSGTHSVGALILGAHDEHGRLIIVGHVGTGFSAVERRRLHDLLTRVERETSPLPVGDDQWRGVRWVRPQLVGEVEYREYSRVSGLRHPSWKGLRDSSIDTVVAPVAGAEHAA